MDLEMRNLLRFPMVTGAGGFIGSHLCMRLAELDFVEKIFAIDLPGSARLTRLSTFRKISTIQFNLLNDGLSQRLNPQPTVVFALAAMNGTSRFYNRPLDVLMASSYPTTRIISEFGRFCPIVYSSSSEVYASTINRNPCLIPTKEDVEVAIEDVRNPRWSYAAGKIFGEVAMQSARTQFGLRGVIVRYHNVYGPNMGLDHFVPDFVERARNGVFQIYGPEARRSFMYIEDAIDGTIAALKAKLDDVEVFNLGTNEEYSIREAARLILMEMGMNENLNIEYFDSPLGSVMRRIPDINKAQEILNWTPKVSFQEGIRRYLNSIQL